VWLSTEQPFDCGAFWGLLTRLPLIDSLSELIRQSRKQVLRTVHTLHVQTCGQMGRHTASQGGLTRALERQIGTLYDERLLSSQDRIDPG
jgi:hypothetical protein